MKFFFFVGDSQLVNELEANNGLPHALINSVGSQCGLKVFVGD